MTGLNNPQPPTAYHHHPRLPPPPPPLDHLHNTITHPPPHVLHQLHPSPWPIPLLHHIRLDRQLLTRLDGRTLYIQGQQRQQ